MKQKILSAKTEQEIVAAFGLMGNYYRDRCAIGDLPRIMLEAVHDRDFPKNREDAQIAFLADSMAACGDVSARRSRQIVRAERKKQGYDPDEYLPSWNEREARKIGNSLCKMNEG